MIKPITRLFLALIIFFLFGVCFGSPKPAHAQAGTPNEVLAEINGLRVANGLDPLIENQYLNIAAQYHAEWIAATLQGGHTGEGGSTPADRALAVGYGGGASVRVTENWARGHKMSAHSVVYDSWAPSSAHINNMLTTWHNEFGAGVALDTQGMTVYVVKFGHVVGAVPPPKATSPPDDSNRPVETLPPLVQAVVTATPNPDGSVYHIVQFGQTVWAIAEAYQISMVDLLEQNYLAEDSAIYEGDKLLVISAEVKATKAVETAEPTMDPSPTPHPTRTPWKKYSTTAPTPIPTATPTPKISGLQRLFSTNTLGLGIGLICVSLLGIALLFITSSRLK